MEETLVGLESEIKEFPAEVEIKGDPYFLLKDGESYRLSSRYCPHAGGIVEAARGRLFCHMHMWSFKETDGACINVPGADLMSHPVELRDGRFYADLSRSL